MTSFNPMRYRVPVLKRLIPSAKKLYCRLFWRDGIGIVRSNNALFRLNYKNFIDRQIAFYGDYEDRQLAFLKTEIKRIHADTFIDIGANIGFFAIIIAKAGLAQNVVAFEPDKRNISRLIENVSLNALSDQIKIHQLAVSATGGELSFLPGPENSTGQSMISRDGDNTIPVEAIAIDRFLPMTGQKLGIKIDVEGHELDVLKGMSRTLQDNNCVLQIEIYKSNLRLVTDFLLCFGYRQIQFINHDYFFRR
jgi:FkbM family methyltransferase